MTRPLSPDHEPSEVLSFRIVSSDAVKVRAAATKKKLHAAEWLRKIVQKELAKL